MDVMQYIAEFPAKISSSCYSVLHKAHMIYFGMLNEIPKGSIESGMLQTHPFVVLGAWASYKLKLEKIGDRIVNHAVKITKEGIKKIDKGLEGKI